MGTSTRTDTASPWTRPSFLQNIRRGFAHGEYVLRGDEEIATWLRAIGWRTQFSDGPSPFSVERYRRKRGLPYLFEHKKPHRIYTTNYLVAAWIFSGAGGLVPEWVVLRLHRVARQSPVNARLSTLA